MPKQPLSRGFEPMRAGLAAGAGALLFVLALFMAAFTPNAPAAITGALWAKPLPGPTVIIQSPEGFGSGIYIGDGYILTAAHNLIDHDISGMQVKTEDGKTQDGIVVMWVNPVYDLALIRQKDVAARPAFLACREPVLNEPITVIGNPYNVGFLVTHGYVSSGPIEQDKWGRIFAVDAAIRVGNSGGPVFDSRGSVIGIVIGLLSRPPSIPISVAVPSSIACMLLAKDQPT